MKNNPLDMTDSELADRLREENRLAWNVLRPMTERRPHIEYVRALLAEQTRRIRSCRQCGRDLDATEEKRGLCWSCVSDNEHADYMTESTQGEGDQ